MRVTLQDTMTSNTMGVKTQQQSHCKTDIILFGKEHGYACHHTTRPKDIILYRSEHGCTCHHTTRHKARQSSFSYFPLFSSPAHSHCTQLDPRSHLTFQRGIWHQWKLGLLCYYLCLQILQHFVAVSIACCGKARIFDCMNVGVFISPVSSFLKPVIHFCDSVL